ncbi:uncharacterized protein FIBRA_01208 [Fibroporia radiculosa]|uniref:Uncharacterized protein n=1 Tax=Fibroporia radiculosa TaxID=599839 RepID=J4G0V1_9APHY|nr:uncharacterized protein FIBRA_01208 [Fibroporia radiculosa]CCL99193.1 predicted protein [Fibroporia radiculosa]
MSFLFVDGNLGVPQKVLYKFYMLAISPFAQSYKKFKIDAKNRNSRLGSDPLISLSAVLLLANPAHQSALNARKRLVEADLIDPKHDLIFTESLLTLRDASKQSILWHHRRWLLRRIFQPLTLSPAALSDDDGNSLQQIAMPPDVLQHEFSVVSRACDTYHRNYYARAHGFFCLEALNAMTRTQTPDKRYSGLLQDEYQATRTWIEQHVSDYTAVQYLRSVYDMLLQDISRRESVQEDVSKSELTFFVHAQRLVEAYPDHESLWLYLRAAACILVHSGGDSGVSRTTISDIHAFARQFIQERGKSAFGNGRCLSVANEGAVRNLAHRCIVWLDVQSGVCDLGSARARKIIADNDSVLTPTEI